MMVGTAAFVLQVTGSVWPKSNTVVLYLLGVCRFSLDKMVMEEPYPVGIVSQLDYLSAEEGRSEVLDFVSPQKQRWVFEGS
jgi:hypothetical protein